MITGVTVFFFLAILLNFLVVDNSVNPSLPLFCTEKLVEFKCFAPSE